MLSFAHPQTVTFHDFPGAEGRTDLPRWTPVGSSRWGRLGFLGFALDEMAVRLLQGTLWRADLRANQRARGGGRRQLWTLGRCEE